MSRLESAVIPIFVPMMKGKDITLSKKQQKATARWLIKTAMMMELTLKGPHYFTPDERHSLCKRLTVPTATLMYAARYFGSRQGHVFHSQINLVIQGRSGPTVSNGYTMTFAIKQLALQLCTIHWPKEVDTDRIQWRHMQNWGPAIREFWPIASNFLKWPPPLVLDDKHLDIFTNRWLTMSPPRGS
jgi:hypothetical protein